MGESLFLAACHDYVLSVHLLLRLFVWKIKFLLFSSSYTTLSHCESKTSHHTLVHIFTKYMTDRLRKKLCIKL